MEISDAIDQAGVAVITGGASGLGFNAAERLVRVGMRVAILDASANELAATEKDLGAIAVDGGRLLCIRCDVTKFEECRQAEAAVVAHFSGSKISFLFNNAGIGDQLDAGKILEGGPGGWEAPFRVNVFGAMHIFKAFLPRMISAGPLPSGKETLCVTTSSVVGLLNHNTSPYCVSKFAVTAMCEQLACELLGMGPKAAHISPRTLHPTVVATNFHKARGADATMRGDDGVKDWLGQKKAFTAVDIVDGLFKGLNEGKHYIIVDHPHDIPTAQQLAMRLEDQMTGRRPRPAEQLGSLLVGKALKSRLSKLGVVRASKL